jgi:hypothetical protein
MQIESKLAKYVSDTNFSDLAREPVDLMKKVVLTIIGTTIAGATSEGCEAIVNQVKEWGGKKEATILIYGGKVPAYNAVLANSTMARALDICDGMDPGIHIGSSDEKIRHATIFQRQQHPEYSHVFMPASRLGPDFFTLSNFLELSK